MGEAPMDAKHRPVSICTYLCHSLPKLCTRYGRPFYAPDTEVSVLAPQTYRKVSEARTGARTAAEFTAASRQPSALLGEGARRLLVVGHELRRVVIEPRPKCRQREQHAVTVPPVWPRHRCGESLSFPGHSPLQGRPGASSTASRNSPEKRGVVWAS